MFCFFTQFGLNIPFKLTITLCIAVVSETVRQSYRDRPTLYKYIHSP